MNRWRASVKCKRSLANGRRRAGCVGLRKNWRTKEEEEENSAPYSYEYVGLETGVELNYKSGTEKEADEDDARFPEQQRKALKKTLRLTCTRIVEFTLASE